MSTKCYSMVRGSAIRVTGLKPCGSIPDPTTFGVSKSVTRVTINEETESGDNELLRNEEDEPRLHFITPTEMVRFSTDIEFIRCDPGILNLVSGVPVVENAVGDIVGFDSNTRLPAKAFALEVWAKLQGQVLDSPGGCAREYGYSLFPLLKGGVLSGFQFANGRVSFTLRNAKARRSAKWGYGPYETQNLLTPVSGNLMWRNFITTTPPPTQTDGVEELVTEVIEGGNASSTSSDILDGQFVTTSSDTVEGGYAT